MSGYLHKPTQPHQWTLGSKRASARFGAQPLNPSGKWAAYAPPDEPQAKNGVETDACTVFASNKAWITLATFLGYATFDFPLNLSERFNAVMANITPPGANPHDVAESIRTWGAIPETSLPFDQSIKTLAEFYSPKPMDEIHINEAKKLVQKYELGHEYVFNDGPSGRRTPNKQALLKAAMTRGPVCVSMYAWNDPINSIYHKEPGQQDEHWIFLADYVDGQYWIAHDQYEPFIKKIAWDTDFETAEVYFLQTNASGIAPNDRTIFSALLRAAFEALQRLKFILAQHPPQPRETAVEPTPQPVPPPVTVPESEPQPKPAPISKVRLVALAQQEFEGWFPGSTSYTHNNPGNCKGVDGKFLTFKTYNAGLEYLEDYITRVAKGVHPAYPHGGKTTIEQYTHTYTSDPEPSPTNYAACIVRHLTNAGYSLSTGTPMSWLLT